MSPRKRKLTATSKHTSKRVKRSSLNINNTQSTEDSKEIISVKSQDKFYKLKDILDEKRGKYLIDWEDDPDTGEKYSPSWVCQYKESSIDILEFRGRVWLLWI